MPAQTPDAPKRRVPAPYALMFGNREVDSRLFFSVFFLIMPTLFYLTYILSHLFIAPPAPAMAPQEPVVLTEQESVSARVRQLKQLNLWDITSQTRVPQVVFTGYPHDLHTHKDVTVTKKVFLHSLLPVALIALDEVKKERGRLEVIIQKSGLRPEELVFTRDKPASSWADQLSADQVLFIQQLVKKYRTARADLLLKRIDVLPVSLVLAQGAIESSWGRSRFARQGNNLFGIWTWSGKGIVPAQREEGKSHRVRAYDTILDSVRSYLLTINRVTAYEPLRRIRQQTKDPLALSEGLRSYSERREAYVEAVKQVVTHNRLRQYDRLALDTPRTGPGSGLRRAGISAGQGVL